MILINLLPPELRRSRSSGVNPVLLAAMSDVEPSQSGLASGVVNTSFMMGGALGLAVLASLADLRTKQLLGDGTEALLALNRGYQLAFVVGAMLTLIAAVLSAALIRPGLHHRNQAPHP